jgi:hypothetical protein
VPQFHGCSSGSRGKRTVTNLVPMPAPPDADALADALADARYAHLPQPLCVPGTGLYLLIDPMLGDPVLPESPAEGLSRKQLSDIREAVWQRATFALELPPHLGLDAALAPYLVELLGTTDPWMFTSISWAAQETVKTWLADETQTSPHRVGGWIQSPAHGPQLAQAMSGWLRLSTRCLTSARYLRLADRRVLSLAVHVLGEASVATHLAPVQHWHWLDPNATWRSLHVLTAPSASQANPNQAATAPGPLATFEPAQWHQMALGPAVHAHMARSTRARLARHDTLSPAQWAPVDATQWQSALAQAQSQQQQIREEPSV